MEAKKSSEVVMITGASAGIGRATAQAFARRGANIGLLARDRDRLEAAKSEVEGFGGRGLVLVADVADDAVLVVLASHLCAGVAGRAVNAGGSDRVGHGRAIVHDQVHGVALLRTRAAEPVYRSLKSDGRFVFFCACAVPRHDGAVDVWHCSEGRGSRVGDWVRGT